MIVNAILTQLSVVGNTSPREWDDRHAANGRIRPPELWPASEQARHKTALSFAGSQPATYSHSAEMESIFIFADERALFLSRRALAESRYPRNTELCQQSEMRMTNVGHLPIAPPDTYPENQSINHAFLSVVQVIKSLRIHWMWGIIYRGSLIMSGNESWNRNVFKRWRKVDRDGADVLVRKHHTHSMRWRLNVLCYHCRVSGGGAATVPHVGCQRRRWFHRGRRRYIEQWDSVRQ